jgi:large subunit ribosomal protein L21
MYRVAENDRLVVERLPGDPGSTVMLNEVLMIAGDGEAPKLGGDLGEAAVFAEILAQKRGKKILVFKKKRRKNYRRTRGHRQELTELRIAGISLDGEPPAAAAPAEAPVEAPVEAQAASAVDAAGDAEDTTPGAAAAKE